ncbi:uncharacterized protein LOC143453244 isoform X4 [Clavelina lepadiformis]|uniref:uncharacterized protein LOC143451443 isoform X4 n=1 Tax=Clavelina lepadiformis TaxID=159417 RepID=UPI0040432267
MVRYDESCSGFEIFVLGVGIWCVGEGCQIVFFLPVEKLFRVDSMGFLDCQNVNFMITHKGGDMSERSGGGVVKQSFCSSPFSRFSASDASSDETVTKSEEPQDSSEVDGTWESETTMGVGT